MATDAKISFGMIVLNAEPFLRYSLRALLPHAHEILVVEGACPAAAPHADAQGHSTDGTVETLRRFQAEEDPEGKVTLIQRDGLWRDKDEQSRAYAERATGDWLWQVDGDEFYLEDDLRRMAARLAAEPDLAGASFRQLAFWGRPEYRVDGFYLHRGAEVFHRLFRWGPGYRYVTHRPPTVCDAEGRDLRTLRWLDAASLAREGIQLYHYPLLFPRQVREKCAYYAHTEEPAQSPLAERWARECWERLGRPFRVHNVYQHPSWLERFEGPQPAAVVAMMADVQAGRLREPLRDCADVERLLDDRGYRARRALLRALKPVDALLYRLAPWLRRVRGLIPRSWYGYRPRADGSASDRPGSGRPDSGRRGRPA